MKLSTLITQLGGALQGADVDVDGIATLAEAGSQQLSFLSNPKYRQQLLSTHAGAVIVPPSVEVPEGKSAIVTPSPYLYFAKALGLFHPPVPLQPGIHPSAVVEAGAIIDPTAEIGPLCWIGPGAQVGAHTRVMAQVSIGAQVTVGRDCLLHPGVRILTDTQLGDRVIIHAGAVLGSDGFGLAPDAGRWHKIPQVGRVCVGNDVEIGANTTIDRGALSDTILADGVKLDNQIQIAHNVQIGAHTAIAGCVGIAGSAVIGQGCTIGGGAVILGHLSLADGVHVSAGTLVSKSIRQPGTYTGVYPFAEHDVWQKAAVLTRQLPRLEARLKALEKIEFAQTKD